MFGTLEAHGTIPPLAGLWRRRVRMDRPSHGGTGAHAGPDGDRRVSLRSAGSRIKSRAVHPTRSSRKGRPRDRVPLPCPDESTGSAAENLAGPGESGSGPKREEADALEQLGYQAESGPWRNFYLTGAKELREGVRKSATPGTASPDSVSAMPLDLFFDYLAVRLDPAKAAGKTMNLNWSFPDINKTYVLSLENCVLNHTADKQVKRADASITVSRKVFNEVILKQATVAEKMASGEIRIEGNPVKIQELFSLLDTFDFWFNIVTP